MRAGLSQFRDYRFELFDPLGQRSSQVGLLLHRGTSGSGERRAGIGYFANLRRIPEQHALDDSHQRRSRFGAQGSWLCGHSPNQVTQLVELLVLRSKLCQFIA